MKIPAFFKVGPLEAAYIRAGLRIHELEIYGQIEFIIDTGATRTIVSDRDALWLGIDYRKLRKTKASMGIGGTVDTYEILGATLSFATESRKSFKWSPEKIFAIKHKKIDEKVKSIPSILGRDFLNRFTLVYSKKTERVFIPDESFQQHLG